MALSPRHSRVLDHYFSNGFNQKQALLDAGYSSATAATGTAMIFSRPDVKKEMQIRRDRLSKKTEVTPEWIINRLRKVAAFDLPDIFDIHEDGSATVDLNLLTPDMAAAIGEYTVEESVVGKGDNAMIIRKARVKPRDMLGALAQLARIFGMFNDRVSISDEADTIKRIMEARRKAGLENAPPEEEDEE